MSSSSTLPGRGAGAGPGADGADSRQDFRFYDNRQKYLMFVNTCSEKWVVGSRVAHELAHLQPIPPAIRLFDAGVGDGTVLTRVMRSMHRRFQFIPFYIVGKEISLEDVRLTLEKLPDRFHEHPATVLVMTNLSYADAPILAPSSAAVASQMVWRDVALSGSTAAEFEEQITALQPFLAENWRARATKSGGNTFERPVALVLYREDCRFMLDHVRPRQGATCADFDLIIASQPYRARAPAEFKATKVLAPLIRSLAPGGRLIGIQSYGDDPGLELIHRIWPGERPFGTHRHALLKAVEAALGDEGRRYDLHAQQEATALFRYEMHTLPNEIGASAVIGTSTLFAAWNAATYVAQIDDRRLAETMGDNAYLDATSEVLREHGSLWFWDESYVIARKCEASGS